MVVRDLGYYSESFTRSPSQAWSWPAFFAFVVSWGDYLFVSILSQSPETQTLPIGLQTFMSSLQVRWGLITAGTVIAIVPTIVFFAIVQRRLVAGLTAGAVK